MTSFVFLKTVCLVRIICIIRIGLLDDSIGEKQVRIFLTGFTFLVSFSTCLLQLFWKGENKGGYVTALITGKQASKGKQIESLYLDTFVVFNNNFVTVIFFREKSPRMLLKQITNFYDLHLPLI